MSDRLAKFNSVVKAEAGAALGDLRLAETLATVTAADTSPDLATAIIWISVLPSSPETWEQIEAHRPVMQAHLADRLESKRTPKIELREDRGMAHAEHVGQLLS